MLEGRRCHDNVRSEAVAHDSVLSEMFTIEPNFRYLAYCQKFTMTGKRVSTDGIARLT